MPVFKPPLPRLQFGHPLAQGSIGVWSMHEKSGDTIRDVSPSRNQGTNVGAAWVNAESGPALEFVSAETDRIDIADPMAALPDDTGEFTVGVRFKTTTGSRQVLFAWADSTQNRAFSFLNVDGANFHGKGVGALVHFKRDDSGGNALNVGGGVGNDGDWHMAVVSKSSTDVYTVYVDGQQVAQDTLTTGALTSNSFVIGALFLDGSHVLHFDGQIDMLAPYDRVLSATEVAQWNVDAFAPVRPQRMVVNVGLPIPVAVHHYEQLAGAS